MRKFFSDPADRLVSGVALAVSALASVVLVGGWGFGIERLRTVAPVWSAMAPLTAVLLILVSISLVFLERRRTWANVAMILTALIAAAILAEYLFDADLGLERLMRVFDPVPELPAPDSAAAFLLLTLALVCWRTSQTRLHDFADVVAVLIGLVCLQVLLAYGYSVVATSSWHGFRQIAPHSTVAVGLLAFAATARRPTLGLYGAMRGSAQSALQLRRLLPATIVFCAVLGLLHTLALAEHIAGVPVVAAWTVIAATTGLAVLLFITSADMRQAEAAVRQRQQELQAAKAEAEAASEAKSRFMAVMSHELRTPLTAVIGYANLLDEGLAGEPNAEARKYADRIRASGWHLVGLIDSVLLYANGEGPQEELRLQRVDVNELIATTAAMFEREAAGKGLALRTSAEGPAWVITDLRKLRQMLTNLIANAVKFTDRGDITVRARVTADQVILDVEDTGIGISEAQVDEIWEPFHQVDSSHTRIRGGMGMGLAVTRKMAEQIGARLEVRSSPAGGSTFTIALSRAEQQDARTIQLNGVRVLVVDDEPAVRRIMVRTLMRHGGDVTQAESAHEALGVVAEQDPFDVVVTDISMPEVTGIELAQQLQARNFKSPILFVTGAELDNNAHAAILRVGGRLLRKPFDMVDLVRAVQLLVEAYS